MPFVSKYLDPANYGGFKKSSTMHYLLKLLHFIHSNTDASNPKAVLLTQADLKRAFNKTSFYHIIVDLHDMHVPPFLLRILTSYLTGRNMTLSFNAVKSSVYALKGSCPQGVFLGVFFFIISYNGAFLRPAIPRLETLSSSDDEVERERRDAKSFTAKYVDDSSHATVVDLTTDLEENKDKTFPLRYYE